MIGKIERRGKDRKKRLNEDICTSKREDTYTKGKSKKSKDEIENVREMRIKS